MLDALGRVHSMRRGALRLLFLQQQGPAWLFSTSSGRATSSLAQAEALDLRAEPEWQFRAPGPSRRAGHGHNDYMDRVPAGQNPFAASQEQGYKYRTEAELRRSGGASTSGRSAEHQSRCSLRGLHPGRSPTPSWRKGEAEVKQALRAASTLTDALSVLESHRSPWLSAQLSAQGMASIMRLSQGRLPYHLVQRREKVIEELTACLESGSTLLSARDIVTFAYSLARLGYGRPRVFAALEACALRTPSEHFTPRDLEQMVWGFAQAKFHAPTLLSELQPLLINAMQQMEPWQISNVMSGLAAVHHPAAPVFDAAAGLAMVQMHKFPARSLTALVAAFATAGHPMSDPLASMVERRALQVMSEFSANHLATLMEAFVALGHDASELLLVAAGTVQPSAFSAAGMARLLRASTGQVRMAGEWRRLAAPSIDRLLRKSSKLRHFLSAGAAVCVDDLGAIDLVDLLYAVAVAKLPAPNVFARAEPLCREALPLLDTDTAARMAWCFASAAIIGVSTREAAARALAAVDRVVEPVLQGVELRTMATLLEAHALVGCHHPQLFEAVVQQIRIRASQLETKEASQILWAISQVRHCSSDTVERLAKQLAETSRDIDAVDLAQAIWAYVAAGCDDNSVLSGLAAKTKGRQFGNRGFQQLLEAEALTGFTFLPSTGSRPLRNRLDGSDCHTIGSTSDVAQLSSRVISSLQSMRELGVDAGRAAGHFSSPCFSPSDILLRSDKSEEFLVVVLEAEAFTFTQPRRLMGEAYMRARVIRAMGKIPVLVHADELSTLGLPSEIWNFLYKRYLETKRNQYQSTWEAGLPL